MTLRLYTLLLYLLSPLFLLAGWRRCRKARRLGLKQPFCLKSRLGYVPAHWQRGGIWIHAVSVGESRSIFPLLEALKKRYPNLPITVTNGSVQGALQIQQFAPIPVQNSLIPYDFPFAMGRFLQQLQPRLVIVIETELWPHLADQCQQRKIPVMLLNARLKETSFKRYQRWGQPLVKETLQKFQLIGAQFPQDKERFITLGASEAQVKVLGNLKFDLEIPQNIHQSAQTLRTRLKQCFIWVAGSTHAHEEEKVLKAHAALLKHHPDALLILVPRHADRFEKVAALLAEKEIPFVRRSQGQLPDKHTHVWLGDSIGELLMWYAMGDVAFVGGTLVPFGGHNILEPAALAKPVLSGPHYQNLASLYESMLNCGGVAIVPDATKLADKLHTYSAHPSEAKKAGQQAHACFTQHQGVLPRFIQAIQEALDGQ